MKKLVLLATLFAHTAFGQLRQMPAYPLLTHSTYFSVWSFSDTLNSQETRHWTGKRQSLVGQMRVDGKLYRFLGKGGPEDTAPASAIPAMQQWVSVNATQTIYQFTCGGVDLTLTFTSPLLLSDLDLLSRPVSYVSFRFRSNDGATHPVELGLAVSGDL